MKVIFADRTKDMQTSEIREAAKLMYIPGMISFAGGFPAPEMFPVQEMIEASTAVMKESGPMAMQYSPSEGFIPLREKLVARMKEKNGIETTLDNVRIINGCQQGLDFAGRVFVNEGDTILVESPTYLGAIFALKIYEPNFKGVETDKDGMIPESLEEILKTTENVKLIYVIPDFQNPTGCTWSLERRKAFMEIVKKYNVAVLEDNPYSDLRYEGESLPPLKSFDTEEQVIYLSSFSKIIAPGYRVGWVCASEAILEKFNIAKQGADLQPSTISQMEINKYLEMYDLDAHVEKIRALYRGKRDLMIENMKKEFPEEVKFNKPDGGLFIWVKLPKGINSADVLRECVKNGVIYVAGRTFFTEPGNENTFRMSFATMPEDKIVEGVKKLGTVLKNTLSNR